MNRRDSFEPSNLLHQAGSIIGQLLELPLDGERRPAPSLIRFSQRAMATVFEFVFPYGAFLASDQATAGFDLIDALEAQLSIFREDSEVSALNRRAANGPVAVEERLFKLLELAATIHRDTWGAFDVTSGPMTRAWGFHERRGRLPKPVDRDAARNRVGMLFVNLNQNQRSITFQRDGMEINLGSIGKGYALDRVAEEFRSSGSDVFLLHAGGSSVYAAGAQPDSPRGWPVTLCHAWRDESIGTVYLRDRGLGTSAATYQHFEYNNRKLGHILDPRSGRPAEGIASATAIAPTAAEADALATAFYVLGIEKTRLYCQTHPGVGAILLPDAPDADPVTFGLAPGEFVPARAVVGGVST